MLKRVLFTLFTIASSLGFSQLEPNTITITATQSTTLQPDQAVLDVDVTAGLSATLNDVVAALQGVGITATNFNSLSTGVTYTSNNQQTENLQWGFQYQVPLTQLKATITALTSLQQTIGQNNSGFQLSFTVIGTGYSQQALQSQSCSVSTLLSTARAQAQQLASAAGMTSGPVLALATSTTVNTGTTTLSDFLIGSVTTQPCSISVKYGLGAP